MIEKHGKTLQNATNTVGYKQYNISHSPLKKVTSESKEQLKKEIHRDKRFLGGLRGIVLGTVLGLTGGTAIFLCLSETSPLIDDIGTKNPLSKEEALLAGAATLQASSLAGAATGAVIGHTQSHINVSNSELGIKTRR